MYIDVISKDKLLFSYNRVINIEYLNNKLVIVYRFI